MLAAVSNPKNLAVHRSTLDEVVFGVDALSGWDGQKCQRQMECGRNVAVTVSRGEHPSESALPEESPREAVSVFWDL